MKIKKRWTKNKCQFGIFSFNNTYEKQAFLTPSAPLVLQAIPSYYMREKGLINNSPSTHPLGICMTSSNTITYAYTYAPHVHTYYANVIVT